MAIYSFMAIVLFSLLPPSVYSFYTKERDIMYLNEKFYVFALACTLVFCLISLISARLTSVLPGFRIIRPYRVFYFLSILNVGLSLVKIAYIQISFGLGQIFSSYFGNTAGYTVKDELNEVIAGGKIGWIGDATLGAMCGILWIYFYLLRRRKTDTTILLFNILLFTISAFLSLARDSLTTLVIVGFIVYLSSIDGNSLKRLYKSVRAILLSLIVVTSLFYVIDSARNKTSGQNEFIAQLIGYFPASVNRGAAVVGGQLVYPNNNSGYYSTQFIWDLPLMSRLLALPENARQVGLDIPLTPGENWKEQFAHVRSYGFNQRYIWATIYGFTFNDFKWGSIIYFGLYGVIIGLLYSSYRKNSIFGTFLYPFGLATIVKWVSVSAFSQRVTLIILALVFLTLCIDRIKLTRKVYDEKSFSAGL
ncbi:hypothetical protein SAMN00790413_00671 [Deinococcus hopiensis KR-140]|uniref:Oligosaccharide repeat unit polymerase n=2 Tax=Deinococcus TaxID=1298 RepID=A0A1W1VB19_9DEIO|nr:hypothetical protein SAMN00790413_00671 [Deinococcus hopiensis KR-140]